LVLEFFILDMVYLCIENTKDEKRNCQVK
jgi:hypothetical protein